MSSIRHILNGVVLSLHKRRLHMISCSLYQWCKFGFNSNMSTCSSVNLSAGQQRLLLLVQECPAAHPGSLPGPPPRPWHTEHLPTGVSGRVWWLTASERRAGAAGAEDTHSVVQMADQEPWNLLTPPAGTGCHVAPSSSSCSKPGRLSTASSKQL